MRQAWSSLYEHHSYNPLEFPSLVQSLGVMTWHCHTCKVNNTPKMTYCRACHAHWSAVWTAPRRSRSKSIKKQKKDASEYQVTEQASQETDSWAVFPGKLPWISTTPASRAQRKVESGISMDKPLGMPPQPVLPPAPSVEVPMALTAEEEKMLQHLKGLQAMDMDLTESMTRRLEELSMREAKAQSSRTLTHGQLNKLNKLKVQVATAAQKIKDLDQEWTSFVSTTVAKVRQHGEMFQTCRADLMEHYNAKIQELANVKREMTLASQSLLGPQWTEPVIPEMPDLEVQFEDLQTTMEMEGHAGPIDLTEAMEEEELVEPEDMLHGASCKATPRALRPFRGSSSPSKVANHHLKVKAQDSKGQQGCQAQGQGERGQVMDTVALRSHGPCGKLCSTNTSCSRLTSFRKQIKEFWHSHFGQPFSWNSDMSAVDDIMAPSKEDHGEFCSPLFSPLEKQGNYECESLVVAHHNSMIHTFNPASLQ